MQEENAVDISTEQHQKSEWNYLSSSLPLPMAIRKFRAYKQEKEEAQKERAKAQSHETDNSVVDDMSAIEARINEDENSEEEVNKESVICTTVRGIRTKFMERRLVGKIYIHRLSGVISTAMTSHIDEENIANYILKEAERKKDLLAEDPLEQAAVSGQYKRALSMTDAILNSLERRSLAWEGADFAHHTLLTRGSTMGISDPFLGLIGFSFTIQLSATVHSLLASRKRFECTRDLALSRHKSSVAKTKCNMASKATIETGLLGMLRMSRSDDANTDFSCTSAKPQEEVTVDAAENSHRCVTDNKLDV